MGHSFVSAQAAATSGQAGFRFDEADPGTFGLRPSPILLLGPVPGAFGRWHYGDRGSPAAGLFTLDDVTLHGDRVLRHGDHTICIPQNGLYEDSVRAQPVLSPGPYASRHDEVVLLCGPAYRLYGHWLIDFLPRLFILHRAGYDLGALSFLLPGDLPVFARQWLLRLGIRPEQLRFYRPDGETCHIRRALVPTAFRVDGRVNPVFTEAARWIKRTVIGEAAASGYRKLFVSRGRWGNPERSFDGIEQIESAFVSDGFEIVHPQELGLEEQVSLFSEARLLVGEYGTALHNAIFSPPGSIVVALRGTEGHPGFLQGGLCAAMGQSVGYLFGRTRIENDRHFSVVEPDDLSLLRALLLDC